MPGIRRRRQIFSGSGGGPDLSVLMRIGPFASLPRVKIDGSLPDLTLIGTPQITTTSEGGLVTAPLTRGTISLDSTATIVPDYSTTSAVFIWCETFNPTTGQIYAAGQPGYSDGFSIAYGGNGASGGGGGSLLYTSPGGDGGSYGNNGADASSGFAGGTGFGSVYTYSGISAAPIGGDGGMGGDNKHGIASSGGLGDYGCGGGGGGAGSTFSAFPGDGGSGGGGGGLIVIVAREILSTGGYLSVQGGDGAQGNGLSGGSESFGGGGGGGSIIVYCKKYKGLCNTNYGGGAGAFGFANDGGAKIYEVNHAETTATLSSFGASWDNL